MNEKKVYVVTAGCYSDYRIEAIFDSKEKAEEYYLHSESAETHEPEEWTLNEKQANKNAKVYCMHSSFENTDFSAIWIHSGEEARKHAGLFRICKRDYPGVKWRIEFYIEATNLKQAAKIAAERLAFVKTEEHIRYPLLRQKCGFTTGSDYYEEHYPIYDFHTGEIILDEGEELTDYVLPVALDKTLKFREMK